MNATAPAWRPNRRRLWSNWLWLLALVLSAAALWSGARVIHDNRLRRETLRILAHDKAVEIAALGRERFSLLVSDAFGPLWNVRGDGQTVLAALAAYQSARAGCRCADTLPITSFFRYVGSQSFPYDPATRLLTVTPPAGKSELADSVILRVVTAEWDRALREFTHPVVRLTIDSTLEGQAIVTVSDPRSTASGTKIYGAVMPASALAASLFRIIERGPSADTAVSRIVISRLHLEMAANGHHGNHLVQLDSLSLAVTTGGRTLYGQVNQDRYLGVATPPAPLEALSLHVGIRAAQASMAVMMPIAHDRLWMNGVLTLSTLLVIIFAVGSSRREVLLARARSDFIAGVSHDLRMPLAQILLASETLTLGRDRDERERASLTASILREARRLKNMVDNVLLFSRTGAVGLNPHLVPLDVADLFTEVVQSVELSAADAGQTIEVTVEPGLRVIGDRGLLRQAFVNLVDNAIKYGPRGQFIRLKASRAGNGARLAVADEGPGIPKHERARLFEAYERLGRDQTSERTGSGLGLAVVRQIVDACNGRVGVDDTDTGTRIVIMLPADQP
jgi:signal transduction histidine kinase